MSSKRKSDGGGASLRGHEWRRFLRGPDSALLDDLYVPALSEAVRYDRCCSYFSSTVLAAAARGFAKLIERLVSQAGQAPHPAIRLVVNEELAEDDVRAMMEGGAADSLEELLLRRFKTPKDVLEKQRLTMLGWLVKEGLLEVRVGVMRRGQGIVHAKFGIVTDPAGDAIVFSGSGNESASGLVANYERLEVSTSWEDPERHKEYVSEFEALWQDIHPDVHTVTLPEALRLRLVKFAPPEPPTIEPSNALARQKAAMIWRFISEAPYLSNGGSACDATAMVDLWPHQGHVVEETASAWPEGRLLCDEVGLGKTVEAILTLSRLIAGRGVRRALILLPAGLLTQWQAELREKGGLIVPRLEGLNALVWPDDRVEKVEDLAAALERDVLLMSRETARTDNNLPVLLAATPWDLVVLDESHAARRAKQVEGEFNSGTLLLNLLRQLQLRKRARGFLLLSATPMQTHPWEPWDLLSVLGEGGNWLAEFGGVRTYYKAIALVRKGMCDHDTALAAARMVLADEGFPPPPGEKALPESADKLARKLEFAPPTKRAELAVWLRSGSPLTRRMHRNTHDTLRRYYEMGLLTDPPPTREVEDMLFDYKDADERRVYNAITRYIERRFQELEREKPGKGFVMTIYRRRASSSPYALEKSLGRRRDGLKRVIERKAYDADIEGTEDLDPRDIDELGRDDVGGKISSALPTDPQVARSELADVESLLGDLRNLRGRDSKRDEFFNVLRRVRDDGRPVLIFTEYVDTMEYIRDNLRDFYGKSLGCYSGPGGQLWDGQEWKSVTKDVITKALHRGELQALVCTDAASEGLNLQAAGAVINFDLPWNPSKVEQRIGRIDRIGQKLSQVRVVNFFLKNSVDERVYKVLRERCGLFEHFVGSMQPVLARARQMLLGQDDPNVDVLMEAATEVERDAMASETYLSSAAQQMERQEQVLTREQVDLAVSLLTEDLGFKVRLRPTEGTYTIAGATLSKVVCSTKLAALERDAKVQPLTPLGPIPHELSDALVRPGERLPLVLGSHQDSGFRSSVAYWIGTGRPIQISSLAQLQKLTDEWTGEYPSPQVWMDVESNARAEAKKLVAHMVQRARKSERMGLERQVAAARLRLLRELGRYLVCLEPGASDFNALLHRQMTRDIATAQRLRRCLDMLGGYPEWSPDLIYELKHFAATMSENERSGRLIGSQIDAALDDPRWGVRGPHDDQKPATLAEATNNPRKKDPSLI